MNSDRLEQSGCLVVPARGDGAELLFVLATVVGAEQQFAPIHLSGDVCLGAARVTAVACREAVLEDSGLGRCR